VTVQILYEAVHKANLLFLNFSDDFKLDFCNSTKHYFLKNPKANSCHILELLLITEKEFCGKKLLDIAGVLNKSHRWILGFCHGYLSKVKDYKSDDYRDGFIIGARFNNYRK
jgi:hypothetical protein